jgi:hypothetical protein
MAPHISYRNGPHQNRRLADLERRKRIARAMRFRAERFATAH